MTDPLRIALAQMCSGKTHAVNIATMKHLAEQAKDQGADMLALPEVSGLMTTNRAEAEAVVVSAETDPFIAACREVAAGLGLWIHSGSTPVLAPDGRFWNRSTMIDHTGAIRGEYDKIHLFDVHIEGKVSFTESKRFAPGAEAVVVDTPWGGMGLTICYDMRFPYLYRSLAQAGADVIFAPAAFTVPTGEAHWHVLLRSRAIETGTFVLAPAQAGQHADGRETYGHALAVDPWGTVLADLGEGAPQLQVVELDLSRVAEIRSQIPALEHGRDYALKAPSA